MGDRIAVLKAGRVVQFGTPMEILAAPADRFVSELIGGRQALKMMNLISCGQIMREVPAIDRHRTVAEARRMAAESGAERLLLSSHGIRERSYVDVRSLDPGIGDLGSAAKPAAGALRAGASAQDALSEMFRTGDRFMFVEDTDHQIQGVVELEDLFSQVGPREIAHHA